MFSFSEVVSAILGGNWLSIFQACPTGRRPRGRPPEPARGIRYLINLIKQELENIAEEKEIWNTLLCLLEKQRKMDGSPVRSASLVWTAQDAVAPISLCCHCDEERCINARSKLFSWKKNVVS